MPLPEIISTNVLGHPGYNILCDWNGTNEIRVREWREGKFDSLGTVRLDSGVRPATCAYNPNAASWPGPPAVHRRQFIWQTLWNRAAALSSKAISAVLTSFHSLRTEIICRSASNETIDARLGCRNQAHDHIAQRKSKRLGIRARGPMVAFALGERPGPRNPILRPGQSGHSTPGSFHGKHFAGAQAVSSNGNLWLSPSGAVRSACLIRPRVS